MSGRLTPFFASHWGITPPNVDICTACFGRDIARKARAPPRRLRHNNILYWTLAFLVRSDDFSRWWRGKSH